MKILALASAALLFTGAAQAAVVYTNGTPNAGDGGNETTAWIQANYFSLASATTITGGGVYIGTFSGDLSDWDGTFEYDIYADAGGAPGASLASGNAVNVATSDTGISWCCGGNAKLFTFDLASAFNASAGTTYWLGIHLSTDYDRDEIYWVGALQGNHSESSGGTEDNWSSFGPRHNFFLTGEGGGVVPEPATWALMISGFGLVGAALRRRSALTA